MIKLLFGLTTLSLIVIAASLSVMVAKSTFASIPDATGVIHACYSNLGSPQGSLRVIDTASKFPIGAASCKPGETPLSWNTTGIPGAPGINGTNGLTTVAIHTSTGAGTGTNNASETSAFCNVGEKLIGGGGSYKLLTEGGQGVIQESFPGIEDAGFDISWNVSVKNIAGAGSVAPIAYVICASP